MNSFVYSLFNISTYQVKNLIGKLSETDLWNSLPATEAGELMVNFHIIRFSGILKLGRRPGLELNHYTIF